MKLTIRPQRRRGRIEWVLDVRKQGKRTRTFHPTKAAAESAAADIRDQWSVSGHSWATMPARERAEIVLVAEEIKQAGRTWREVWDFYRSAHPVGVPSLPLEEAIARFLEEKTAANRRPRYVEQMARFLRFFARGRERLQVGAITREMLEQWVQGRRLHAATQKNNYLLFGAFFSHALKRGWVARNPCRGIEHPRVERVPRGFWPRPRRGTCSGCAKPGTRSCWRGWRWGCSRARARRKPTSSPGRRSTWPAA
ncbi:MAG: hypothetical protein M5U12_06455 [Verrucomicrobia bacterium]|nr:hypothetical protein [Verrucomicrobiota bacterium]